LGRTLIEYWLEHLARLGAGQVLVLATDRAEQVRARIGDGARWGLRVVVIPETRELTPAEARSKYRTGEMTGEDVRSPAGSNDNQLETPYVVSCNGSKVSCWLAEPDDAILLDHLPGLPQNAL